ncbi:MAG: hypothetical protein ACRD1W_03185 [Vicinamibacterales bacterium]
MGHGCGNGGNGVAVNTNLAYTRFLFVIARNDDDAHGARLRTAGANIARGFFNDFDIDDNRETQVQAHETIQFLVRETEARPLPEAVPGPHITLARHAVQITAKYRPRLQEIDDEFRRRVGDTSEIVTLEGATRNPRYSSAEMVHYANRGAPPRRSGRLARNAIIIPVRKSADWWQKSALERHSYFYPHVDHASASPVKGHAQAAEKGIPSLFRRIYHNPDGYQRPNEFDFLTYFECDDESLPVFEQVMTSLRDFHQNPEWRYVEEGPIWRGRRVLRW